MDASKTFSHANPRNKTNILAVLLWTWTVPFFRTGYSKVLEPTDLFDPLKSDRSDLLGDRLEREWTKELERCKRQKKSPSFLKTIIRCFLWEYFLLGCLHTFNEFGLRLGTPMLIGGLLHYFKDDSNGAFDIAMMYAAGICVATGINAITVNQIIFNGFHIGGKIRIAVCSVVYRKALRLSATALGETAPGKVVNLVANDVSRFEFLSILIQYMWSAPLSGLIIGYFLYCEAGYAGLVGTLAVLVVVPIQSYTGKLSSIFRLQTAIKTDERVRLMDEIISGVQVIKMYAWEKPFCAMVELARRLELKVVRKSSWIRGIYMTFNLFTTRMALYCTLVGMLFLGQPLSAEKVFVFSSYFTVLAHTMSAMFVRGVAEIAECIVAVRRLQHFLMYEEFQAVENGTIRSDLVEFKRTSESKLPDIDIGNYESNGKTNGSVLMVNDLGENTADHTASQRLTEKSDNITVSLNKLTAKWDQKASDEILENVNVDFEKGKLYIIIGAVGAGKSSMISAILGEMWISEGHVDIKGSISYASQEPWVFGSTVRQNILFGQPYDRQRYQRVVKACALLSDFMQFPQGDQTVVGERGSSLSGGQKARINLARSVYRQAEVYIFDDPLSAVDAHVGKHLFEECLKRYLAGKTRILATHQLQYIKSADAILLIEHGKLTRFSNYVELLSERPDYADLLASDSVEITDDSLHEKTGMRRQLSTASTRSREPEVLACDTDGEDDEDDEETTDFLEKTSKGIIKGSIYAKYLTSTGNWCMVTTFIVFFLLTQCLVTLNDLFFPFMVNVEEKRYDQYLKDLEILTANSTDFYEYPIEPAYGYVYFYTAIVLLIFLIGISRSFLFYGLCIRASQCLHDTAFGALIRTGMRFFDTNPSGRILNRFSKDMAAIDELLPKAFLDAGQIILTMVGGLVVVCIVNPIFIAPLAVIAFVFYWIRKVYLRTSKNVKRLEGMMRSPVFTHLNATLNGLSTIRAYGAQEILKFEFDRFQDTHSSAWYMFIVTSTAFGFSLDVLCFIFTTIIIFTLLLISGYSGSEVGIAITSIISMTGLMQWGMRQSAEVANQMMSVERLLEYTLLPPEDNISHGGIGKRRKSKQIKVVDNQLAVKPGPAPEKWPSEGCVRFRSVYLRYADDELPVLEGLDFVIKPREKVGVVGRTGAGKSSLISALFRLARVDGVIEIDGVDTGSIYLEDLRRNISIIPQDPVLFSGTLRKNLDPFNEFSDKELWSVLEEVELKDAVTIGLHGLESKVFNRGTNYSAGQRQLVCLARAILRNNKVLMLDEATANVDPHTDGLIQKTIRTKFASCTVLTVAHRLNTIMDSDKVLVMDKGRLIEFDHPHILLQNEQGQFTSLVKETGRTMYDQLVKVAKNAYDEKYRERL